MRFDKVLTLLDMEEVEDNDGFFEKIIVNQRNIFGSKKSVKSSEFYAASQSGYSLEVIFEIFTDEYSSQNYVDFESARYQIIRTFEKGKTIELVCQVYKDTP
jgi:SPP1 family predicted phage head-tail adaptor